MGRTVWYPGHMAKGRRQLEGAALALDLMIEVRDARAPRLTASPALTTMPASLEIWTVLAKADLADPSATDEWMAHLSSAGRRAWALDLRSGLPASFKKALASARPKSSGGKTYREVRTAVAGVPNVGKSTLLNRIVGRKAASVGGVPGVTKGVAWYRGSGVLVADSPGILDPHDDARAHRMLSWLSSTKGQVIGSWEALASECLDHMQRRGIAHIIEGAWGVDASSPPHEAVERIGRRLGRVVQGGAVDMESAGRALIDALASGRLGRVTLERPSDRDAWEELA